MSAPHLAEFPLLTQIVFGLLTLSWLLGFIRLVRGPSLPDRVVALELIGIVTVAGMIVYNIATNESAFLDAAIVMALVGFLATIAFARYLERRARGG